MKLTYIFHSGFALETENCMLVFDYWLDPAHVIDGLLKCTISTATSSLGNQ